MHCHVVTTEKGRNLGGKSAWESALVKQRGGTRRAIAKRAG
jgi:hypothetical protein